MKHLLQKAILGFALALVVFAAFAPVASFVHDEFASIANAFPQTYAQRSH